nr:hypothetical protein SUGSMm_24800 [Morganella morganii subsp. sibonii]
MGELVNSGGSTAVRIAGNGGWESIEMVRRYAHLAPGHLSQHAQQIDAVFGEDVPNMSHPTLSVVGEHK